MDSTFLGTYLCRYNMIQIRVWNPRRHGTLLYGLVVLDHCTQQQATMSKCSAKISTSLSFPDFAATSRLRHSFHFTGFQTKRSNCRARDWTQKTLLIKTILALLDKLRAEGYKERENVKFLSWKSDGDRQVVWPVVKNLNKSKENKK